MIEKKIGDVAKPVIRFSTAEGLLGPRGAGGGGVD